MITLITGVPGSGKSAALVDLLSKLAQGRALYCNGIPDLLVSHIAWTDEQVRDWHNIASDGSAIVVDEVQRIWSPSKAAKTPDIAALEVHRHSGLDFFLVTQSPKLLHANVRALVGRHIHLREVGVLGRWWYEWPECSEAIAWKTAPIKRKYRLPKAAFALYKSASLHVKPIRSFNWMLVLLIAAICIGLFFANKVRATIQSKMEGAKPPASAASAPLAAQAGAASAPLTAQPATVPPATAAAPLVLGCIANAVRCVCIDGEGAVTIPQPEVCRRSASSGYGLVKYGNAAGASAPGAPMGAAILSPTPTLASAAVPSDPVAWDVGSVQGRPLDRAR